MLSNHKKPVVLLIIIALMNLVLGCDRGSNPVKDTDVTNSEDSMITIDQNDLLMENVQVFIDATDNEPMHHAFSADIDGEYNVGGAIVKTFYVKADDGSINEYRFEISPTNFNTTVFNEAGSRISGISMHGTETDAYLEYWAGDDFVSINVVDDNSYIAFNVTDAIGTESVSFQNQI